MFSIYEAGNHLLICADYVEPVMHSHSAAHIMISLENEIEVILENEKIQCRGIFIPSGMAHTANTGENKVLIFLFDSTTNIAKQMNEILVLDDELVDGVVKAYHVFTNGDKVASDYRKVVENAFKCVNMDIVEPEFVDERVVSALKYICANLQEPLICSDVAKQVSLSEGRFSHLFKEQVGMTFAAYLIYQRVMKTYVEIENFARENLTPQKEVFFLYTCAMDRNGFTDSIKEIALEKDATILGEYGCKGYNTYEPWKLIGGMNKNHPTENEIQECINFYEKL